LTSLKRTDCGCSVAGDAMVRWWVVSRITARAVSYCEP
jgi:hypothetical protein